MNNQYQPKANSGAIFSRKKNSQNAPDMGGDITIGGDLLNYIIQEARAGREPKIELSAWRRMSTKNEAFLSLQAQIPYSVRQQQGQPQRPQAQVHQMPQRQPVSTGYAQVRGGGGFNQQPRDDGIPPWERG